MLVVENAIALEHIPLSFFGMCICAFKEVEISDTTEMNGKLMAQPCPRTVVPLVSYLCGCSFCWYILMNCKVPEPVKDFEVGANFLRHHTHNDLMLIWPAWTCTQSGENLFVHDHFLPLDRSTGAVRISPHLVRVYYGDVTRFVYCSTTTSYQLCCRLLPSGCFTHDLISAKNNSSLHLALI